MVCDSCGKDKRDVEIVIDPYSADIDNEEVEMALCKECEEQRIDDI